jgi:hypothetical protein
LLTSAAGIMSVLLISRSIVTTVLIPQAAFEPGGERADTHLPEPTANVSRSNADA